MLTQLIVSLFLFWSYHETGAMSYYGNKVYRFTLSSKKDVKNMMKFIKYSATTLDYWQTELHIGGQVDIRVTPSQRTYLETYLLSNISRSLQIDDVQNLLDEMRSKRPRRSTTDDSITEYDYSVYNTAGATHRELHRLAKKFPDLARLVEVGTTFQGRPLLVLEISGSTKELRNSPWVWVDGGMHAREWITVSSSMHFVKNLLEGYGKNARIKKLLNSVTFAIQPLSNPDGYAYSWTAERLWRKNRSPTSVAWCRGVDLNRNFDINFGGQGASDFSCAEIYAGSNAFSELESQAIARYLSSIRHKLLAYFSLHSYGQMWLTPLSYTRKPVKDRALHLGVAEHATQAIKRTSGHRYSYGPATSLMYLTSGDSSDWVYSVLNCSHTYAIELGDLGRHGFVLPEQHIGKAAKDVMSGIVSAVEYITSDGINQTSNKKQRKFRRRKWKSFQ